MGGRPALVVLLVACSGGGSRVGPDGAGDAATLAVADGVPVPDAPPPGQPWFDVGLRRGRIEVVEWPSGLIAGLSIAHAAFAPYPTLMRFVLDGTFGWRHWQQETMRDGACRLLELVPAFCDPECSAGICIAPDVCEPGTDLADAGALTFDGIVGPPVTLVQDQESRSYGQSLGSDAFAPATTIAVTAAGAQVPGFTVAAGGVAPLVATIPNDRLSLVDGTDATLAWTPVDPGDPTLRVRVTINGDNSFHGSPFSVVLECDTADTGSVTIPAAMIARLPTMDGPATCSGDCPGSSIKRYRTAAVDVGGAPVDLVVGSEILFWVVHP